ncbi:hypothetical protein [Streptomyces sp. NPDC053427]|uniref:hypothetical protein n=1 Tax=Streptomyces sp. NPDC053427 TaxID=3365701 RepID=UPI0037D26B96
MNRRHVRTAAVCGLTVVALTGAAGCGTLVPKAKINVPGGVPTSGTLTEAESDVTITSCHYDSTAEPVRREPHGRPAPPPNRHRVRAQCRSTWNP